MNEEPEENGGFKLIKYKFSDRNPEALRSRLKQVNMIIDKWDKSNWPWGLHPEECDIMYEEMMEIKRISEVVPFE